MGAMRGARRAVGCTPTHPRSPRHEELELPTTEEPSGPTAVPPRGVEPRTMPTIRPTGRHRPTAFSVRRESQLTCVDVVGQFDFQLQSAACSCCSTPASASRRTNLSMMPVKPMVPKKSTPPVQKVETWATFEPPSPPEENLRLIRCKHKYRSSIVHSRICTRSRANLATCPKSEHGIRAGAAHAAWICMQPHVAPQGWVNLAAAGWRSRAERGRGTPRTFLGGGAGAHDVPAEVEQSTRRRNGHSTESDKPATKDELTFYFPPPHTGDSPMCKKKDFTKGGGCSVV